MINKRLLLQRKFPAFLLYQGWRLQSTQICQPLPQTIPTASILQLPARQDAKFPTGPKRSSIITLPISQDTKYRQLKELFETYDLVCGLQKILSHSLFFKKDKNGTLELDEIKNMIEQELHLNLSEEKLQNMLRMADKEKDGVIDFNEFRMLFEYLGMETANFAAEVMQLCHAFSHC